MIDFEKELKKNIFEIIESISDEVLISDGSGRVLWVNPGFETCYGIAKEQAMGRYIHELEEEGVFRPAIVPMVIEKKEKITMVQKTHEDKDILVTATPIFNRDGSIRLVVSYSRDITEMMQLEKKHSRMRQRIEKYTAELHELRKEAGNGSKVIGQSKQMENVISTINRIADLDANVLLLGESGVGKSMFAKVIHQRSHRSGGPFIDINCAAIPENLLESELFGYEKGAFTGANAGGKVGLMELADGGTLLLDEISEIPVSLQAKLLTAIQEKRITRVGGTKPVNVDFRLIAASNRQLDQYAAEGKFRMDLYYRLNVVNITIPPLRERKEDIIPLLEYYTAQFSAKYNISRSFSPQAVDILTEYPWPGNVRELANVTERVIVTSSGSIIGAGDLPEEISKRRRSPEETSLDDIVSLSDEVEKLEADLISRAYEKYRTTTGVAAALGISQPTAFRKIEKYIKS